MMSSEINSDMIKIAEDSIKNNNEIIYKDSNKILDILKDKTQPTINEANTIKHILEIYKCESRAKETLETSIHTSYYKIIDGIKYDRSLLLLANDLVKGQGDGRISLDDSKLLINAAKDGSGITDIEKKTLVYISTHYNLTTSAKEHLEDFLKF